MRSACRRRQHSFLPNFTTIRQSFTDDDERVFVRIFSLNTRESCTCFWPVPNTPGFTIRNLRYA